MTKLTVTFENGLGDKSTVIIEGEEEPRILERLYSEQVAVGLGFSSELHKEAIRE